METFAIFMWFDINYAILVMLPSILIAGIAQMIMKSAYAKYSRVMNANGWTGAQVAAEILRRNSQTDGVEAYEGMVDTGNVRIEAIAQHLGDHYDPAKQVLRLSPEVYNGRSVAALGIAAHEAGHAIQHARNYFPLHLRSTLVPVAGLGSAAAFPLAMIGLFIAPFRFLIDIGIILFAGAVLFYLVTLPVEFNASRRAMACLTEYGIVSRAESRGARAVLTGAALTYVAAAATAILQLLYLVMLRGDD